MKNIFKKSSKIFNKDGFYVILFVCLCIVAVAAVYITNKGGIGKLGNNKPGIEDNQKPPVNNADLVEDDEKTKPVAQQPPTTPNDTKDKDGKKTETTKDSATFKIDMPVEGDITREYTVSSLKFYKAMANGGQWQTHEGTDIACDIGTEVKAVAKGKVVEILDNESILHTNQTGFGITVIVEHSNGYRTVYANLDPELKVKKGDSVKKDDVIGKVGDTTTREAVSIEGSHLHFAVLKKDNNEFVSVDPMKYKK